MKLSIKIDIYKDMFEFEFSWSGYVHKRGFLFSPECRLIPLRRAAVVTK